MGDTSIQYAADAIGRVSASRFLSHIDRYLKASGCEKERAFSFIREPFRKKPADAWAAIRNESQNMALKFSRYTEELINFRLALKGQCKGISDTEDQTRRYFNRMKQQQMGLMAEMSEEAEIIGDLIQQTERMRRLTSAHVPALSHTRCLMDIIRERMARRPTTLLRLKGRDKGIAEMNQVFSDMNASENAWNISLGGATCQDGAGAAADPIRRVNAEIYEQIRRRGQKIKTAEKELKQGAKLLVRLAVRGYSARIRNRLNHLVAQHEARTGSFLQQVDAGRRSCPRH